MDLPINYGHAYMGLMKFVIITVLIMLFIGIVIVVREKQKFKSYKEALFYISLGLFILCMSVVYNCLELKHWDEDCIIIFLSLVYFEQGSSYPGEVIARLVLLKGYIFFVLGLLILVLVILNKFKMRKNRSETFLL